MFDDEAGEGDDFDDEPPGEFEMPALCVATTGYWWSS